MVTLPWTHWPMEWEPLEKRWIHKETGSGSSDKCLAGFVRKKGGGDVGERLSLGSGSSLLCERASSHSRRPDPPFLGLGLASLPVLAKHQWEWGSVGQEAKRHREISWGSL